MANLTDGDEDGSFLPHSLVEKTLTISWGVIGIVGMVANAFVIFIFLRVPSLRSITNLFLMHQSLLDCVSSAILVAVKFIPVRWPLRLGAFNDFICKVWVSEYIVMSLVVASTLNLICVSFERYFAIVHPIMHRNRLTETKARVVMVFVWVLGYSVELVWLVVPRADDGGYCSMVWPSATYQTFSGVYFFTLMFALPVILMTYAYLRIFLSLRQKNPVLGAQTSANSGRAATMTKASRNVIKTLAMVFAAYVCCWLPQQTMFFMFTVGLPVDLAGNAFNVAMVLVNCNMLVNPFIYAFQYRQFIQGVKKTCGWRGPAVAPHGAAPGNSRLTTGTTLRSNTVSTSNI